MVFEQFRDVSSVPDGKLLVGVFQGYVFFDRGFEFEDDKRESVDVEDDVRDSADGSGDFKLIDDAIDLYQDPFGEDALSDERLGL